MSRPIDPPPAIPEGFEQPTGFLRTPPGMDPRTIADLKAEIGEERQTSSTGGQKGTKDETYDDMYFPAFRERARVYAMGAKKYSRGNYRKGYPMSLSFSAMMRHIVAWQSGEDLDPESGLSHLAHAGWHVDNLMHLLWEHPEFDDRIISDEQREINMLTAVGKALFADPMRSIVSDPNWQPPPAGLEPDPNEHYDHHPGDKCFDKKPSAGNEPSIYTPESDPGRWEREVEAPRRHGIREERYFGDDGRPTGR